MIAKVLMVCASAPDPEGLGGVQVHTAALARQAPESVRVHTAHLRAGRWVVERWKPDRRVVALMQVEDRGALEPNPALEAAVEATLIGLECNVLHVHSPTLGPEALARACSAAGTRLAMTIHDHSLVCENVQLLENDRRYCGLPQDPERCDRCLAHTLKRPPGRLEEYRDAMRALVDMSDAFVVPSESVLEHAARVFGDLEDRARVVPWGVPEPRARRTDDLHDGPLRIAIVGMFAKTKGAERLPDLVAACSGLDVEWHLFGATAGSSVRQVRGSARRVVVHGAYHRAQLAERLVEARCAVALLPSIVPESFSLTMSEVLAAGLPVLASNIGALDERVRRCAAGWTFDPWEPASLRSAVEPLVEDRSLVVETARHVASLPHRDEEAMARDHAEIWQKVAEASADDHRPVLQRTEDAARAFERAHRLATGVRPSPIADVAAKIKRTNWYRDFPLRRALPNEVRRRVEDWATRISQRTRS